MMIKIRDFFIKHKIFFAVAVLLPLYHFLIAGGGELFQVKEINYTYHAVDFSMGFCSRLLPGSIYRLLVGAYTRSAVSIYLLFVYAFFIIMLAVLVEQFVLSFKEYQRACLVFVILFLTGPLTFNLFVIELGMLDFYWAIFFLMACLCLQNKYLRFFVPVIIVLIIMTYFAGFVSYAVALLFIIFLYFLKAENKTQKTIYFVIFALSLLLAAAFTFYFFRNDTKNLVYSAQEFCDIMYNKRDAYPAYYDYAFYKYFGPEYKGTRYYDAYKLGFIGKKVLENNNIFESIAIRFKSFLYYTPLKTWISAFVTALIPQSLLVYVLRGYIKKEKSILKRLFIYGFIAADIAMELIGGLFSSDTPRFVGHSVMLLFAFVMYLLCFDYREGMERINALFQKIRYPFIWLFLFFYSCVIMEPYVIKL